MKKMKRARFPVFHCCVWSAALFLLVSGYAGSAFGYEQIAESQNISVDLKRPGMNYVSFEQYQQTIDDLFKIAFTMPRDDDEEGGLNNMIISLNRKIAENPADVDSLVTLGHLYRILRQPAEANRFYRKAIAIKPDGLHLHCFSALMLFQVGRFEEAVKELDAAIQVDATDVHAWLARGRTLARLGNYEAAVSDFKKALKLMPENESVKMLLGHLHEMKGDVEEAYQIFGSLSKEAAENDIARFHLAMMHLRKNETADAVKLLEDMFLKGERDLDFLFQLSMAYMENEEYEKALKIAEVLHFLFPDQSGFDFLMAEIYRSLERFDEAEQLFRLILAEEPDYVDAYIGLAITVTEKSTLEAGLEIFDEGLEHVPGNEKLLKWKEKISKDVQEKETE